MLILYQILYSQGMDKRAKKKPPTKHWCPPSPQKFKVVVFAAILWEIKHAQH